MRVFLSPHKVRARDWVLLAQQIFREFPFSARPGIRFRHREALNPGGVRGGQQELQFREEVLQGDPAHGTDSMMTLGGWRRRAGGENPVHSSWGLENEQES